MMNRQPVNYVFDLVRVLVRIWFWSIPVWWHTKSWYYNVWECKHRLRVFSSMPESCFIIKNRYPDEWFCIVCLTWFLPVQIGGLSHPSLEFTSFIPNTRIHIHWQTCRYNNEYILRTDQCAFAGRCQFHSSLRDCIGCNTKIKINTIGRISIYKPR